MNKEQIEILKKVCLKQILNNLTNHGSFIEFCMLSDAFCNLHIKPSIYTNGITE